VKISCQTYVGPKRPSEGISRNVVEELKFKDGIAEIMNTKDHKLVVTRDKLIEFFVVIRRLP